MISVTILNKNSLQLGFGILSLGVAALGCATPSSHSEVQDTLASPSQGLDQPPYSDVPQFPDTEEGRVQKLNYQIGKLNEQIVQLQSKMASVEEELARSKRQSKLPTTVVVPSLQAQAGTKSSIGSSRKNLDSGFTNDGAIQQFRRANILFEAGQFNEANLAFTHFIRDFHDHPLTGAAQYSLAETYLHQKEWKLAAKEYKQLLVEFDHSSYVPDALKRLSQVEDLLGKSEEAKERRQTLISVFPLSPAALNANESLQPEKTLSASELKEISSEVVEVKEPQKDTLEKEVRETKTVSPPIKPLLDEPPTPSIAPSSPPHG